MNVRQPYAWAYIYEPQAHYDDAAPVLTFQRRSLVIFPWREIPLYAEHELPSQFQFLCWMAARFVEKRDLYAMDAFKAAEAAYAVQITGEKVTYGDPAYDWSRDGANTLADEEIACWSND
jgi:hypothetical protein